MTEDLNTIRPVDAEKDAKGIARIYNRYVTDTTVSFEVEPLSIDRMRERIADISRDFPYYVSCDSTDGHITGFCYAHPWKERSAYNPTLETTIYLAPEVWHKGVGHRLMDRLITDCRDMGFVSLIACVTAENTASCKFHEAIGFRQVSLFKAVGRKFGRLLDVIDFQLML